MVHVTANFQGKWTRDTDNAGGFTTTDGREYFVKDPVIKNRVNETSPNSRIDFFFFQMPGQTEKTVCQYTVLP